MVEAAIASQVPAESEHQNGRDRATLLAGIADLLSDDDIGADMAASYLRHVPTSELVSRGVGVFADLIASHVALATSPREGAAIGIHELDSASGTPGAYAIQLVTDDGRFVVDTMSLTLTRLGWAIRELYHPQLTVTRDADRRLVSATLATPDDHHGSLESWVHIEATPPAGMSGPKATALLREGLTHAMDDQSLAVSDFAAMKQRAHVVAGLLDLQPHVDAGERESAVEMLRWLADDHFVFMGMREHRFVEGEFTPVPGSGLGILRDDRPAVSTFSALPERKHVFPLIMTKDSARSTVHRGGQLVHVSVRLVDESGELVSEHRILGLLASSAYTEDVSRIPVLSTKAARIVELSGFAPDSYGAKAIISTIATYPRDELFQASVDDLAPIISSVAELRERRAVRSFVRWGMWRRFLYVLVSLPRDRYNTAVRNAMEEAIRARVGVESIDFRAQLTESVLARLFFSVQIDPRQARPDIDPAELERAFAACALTWDDVFSDLVAHLPEESREISFSDGYKEDCTPEQALWDLQAFNALTDDEDMQLAMYRPLPDDPADLRVKVMHTGPVLALSDVMPHWTSLGLRVVDERPYEVELRGQALTLYDFGLELPEDAHWSESERERVLEAFEAIHRGRVDADELNELVVTAGLTWRQVKLLRALARYLQQAGTPWSSHYVAQTLIAHGELAVDVVAMLEAKFNPDLFAGDPAARQLATEQARDQVVEALDRVSSLDADRIIRSMLAVVDAMVRTNHYQVGNDVLAFKLLPGELHFLPEPRPMFEVFVHSPSVEGVHLRFGTVARGGLRWSDRAEDFRTEVLGLVKAQMVKNTVIVPVGAKGGFLPRHLPDPGVDRAAWLAQGQRAYRLFVGALLDVTDNLVGAAVVPPARTVRHDADDTYLVVAADKGTASFSDLANAISVERGYWLGDAFASGGSHGYDHKEMGITARGAWESVKRHFGEQGIDCQTTDFTCVGIGDMSGDVFGNGMLQSEHIRLIGAFNHLHVFIDPTPEAASSYRERQRLFGLPRSAWTDYDPALISAGGGVFNRTAKAVDITPPMRAALGLDEAITQLTGNELVQAVLRAPVQLLFNGGIGTYVKASSQSQAEAGDRANDAVRVDANTLRCLAVGEGGNLGFTQRGRIEYARAGGRINTDFIDNSGGVDTSDHEVNIKILLGRAIESGALEAADRNALLAPMTDDIATHVLWHNIDQNIALANASSRAVAMAGVHEDLMSQLERTSQFNRVVEDMPSTEEMVARIEAGAGLTTPELATLMAWTKIDLSDRVMASDLPDDPFLADRLVSYFPAQLRERFAEVMTTHPLRREIITTVAVNRFVNSQGMTAHHRLTEESGAGVADVIRAQLAARSIYSAGGFEVATSRASVHSDVQRELRLAARQLVERGTRWILQHLGTPLDIRAAIEAYAEGVGQVQEVLPRLLNPAAREQYDSAMERYLSVGVSEHLAHVAAGAPFAHVGLGVVRVANLAKRDLVLTASVMMQLDERLGVSDLMQTVEALPTLDTWESQARTALRSDLLALGEAVTAKALETSPQQTSPQQASPRQASAAAVVERWWARTPSVDDRVAVLTSIAALPPNLASLQVAVRTLRTLVDSTLVE